MTKLCFITTYFILLCNYSFAQQKMPHITGKVNISMTQGSIKCDFNLSQLPQLGKQYKILLYRGFNIQLLKNDTGRVLQYNGFYNSKLQGEAAAYIPMINNDTLKLPSSLNLSYVGAFPLYKDTLNSFDFKGFIAFNNKTVRAAEQSKWYPVIYDVINDKELVDVTYDITVDCKDCKTIYINGSIAKAGSVANFKSDKPRQLLLFAGDYDVQSLSNGTFLNAGLNADEANIFNQNISFITKFYKQYLQIPYGEKITFLQHKAFEPYGSKRSWGFVTFPTIAVAGNGFKSQVNLKTSLFKDTSTYHFYAHELGHYYFGQILQSNSTLKWFFLETMAEFLSIKATEMKYGKVATQRYIVERKSWMNDWQIKPLSQVTNTESIGESYRYYYAPLILLAMEKRFGLEKVRKFCQQALKNTGQTTDYNFLLKNIRLAGIEDKDWKPFEEQVINQKNCKNIFNYL